MEITSQQETVAKPQSRSSTLGTAMSESLDAKDRILKRGDLARILGRYVLLVLLFVVYNDLHIAHRLSSFFDFLFQK